MWKGWKRGESQKSLSNIIQKIREMKKGYRRDRKLILNLIRI
jgi:hypothetical protein